MTPAEQAALALWIEIEPYSHEPWASNDPGFAVKRIAAAIEQARWEERERRDRLCKGSGYAGALMLRVFEQDDAQAAAIRARSQEEER